MEINVVGFKIGEIGNGGFLDRQDRWWWVSGF